MTYVKVTVIPGARKEIFKVRKTGEYDIAVKEEARGNRANIRVLQLLSAHLHVARNKLRITTGHRGRKKHIEVLE